MRAVRLDLLQVRLDVRVSAATLVREEVLRRRALVHEVGDAAGLSARSHITPLTNRDDQLLHWVQEAEVDIEGLFVTSARCRHGVIDKEGGRLVMPQLHEAHVLLVHERRGLGPRDVHVVAPQLGRLDGFGKLRQRMRSGATLNRYGDIEHSCITYPRRSASRRRNVVVATDDEQLVECAELDADADVIAPCNRAQREVLRRVLREEEAQRNDELLPLLRNIARTDQTLFGRIIQRIGVEGPRSNHGRNGRIPSARRGYRGYRSTGFINIQRDRGPTSLTDELVLALGVALHELVDDVHLVARDLLDSVRADHERHLFDHRIAKRLDPRRVVANV
mmetsp:Transcript_66703/g.161030  ORF Transcript_66703/g.161030 Transcript_66703/m.161030 type:complete len:335 (-) Transcript_66703:235-1239(-)